MTSTVMTPSLLTTSDTTTHVSTEGISSSVLIVRKTGKISLFLDSYCMGTCVYSTANVRQRVGFMNFLDILFVVTLLLSYLLSMFACTHRYNQSAIEQCYCRKP